MKKWLKIFLIILAIIVVLIIALVIYGLYTYNQVKELTALAQDKSLQDDFQALMMGDCTKIPNIEAKTKEMETKMISTCKNPGLAYLMSKNPEGKDLCKSINSAENPFLEMKKALVAVKNFCANSTARTPGLVA